MQQDDMHMAITGSYDTLIQDRMVDAYRRAVWKKSQNVKDSTYHKEKMLLCKQAKKGVQLQAEQSDSLADTDEEIDEQELECNTPIFTYSSGS
ncbi:hypothetical protein Tco_0852718 [Tanacetum coccineum]